MAEEFFEMARKEREKQLGEILGDLHPPRAEPASSGVESSTLIGKGEPANRRRVTITPGVRSDGLRKAGKSQTKETRCQPDYRRELERYRQKHLAGASPRARSTSTFKALTQWCHRLDIWRVDLEEMAVLLSKSPQTKETWRRFDQRSKQYRQDLVRYEKYNQSVKTAIDGLLSLRDPPEQYDYWCDGGCMFFYNFPRTQIFKNGLVCQQCSKPFNEKRSKIRQGPRKMIKQLTSQCQFCSYRYMDRSDFIDHALDGPCAKSRENCHN